MESQRMPLGLRQNNPGNIRLTTTLWQGQIGDAHGFVIFDTMQNGVRAAAKILRTYMTKHGLDTVEKIISRWAPPEDNNPTDDYIENVCDRAGFERTEPLHDDAPTIRALLFGMILQEQGMSIEASDLAAGVDLAFA